MAVVAVRDEIAVAARPLELVARRGQEGFDGPIQTGVLRVNVLE